MLPLFTLFHAGCLIALHSPRRKLPLWRAFHRKRSIQCIHGCCGKWWKNGTNAHSMYRNTLVGEMDFFAGDWYVSHLMPISPLNQVNQRIFMIPAVKGSTCMYIHILYKHYIVWLFTIYPQQAYDTKAKPFRNCARWKELWSTVLVYCLLIISNNFSSSLPPSNTNPPINYQQHSGKSRHLRKQPASPPQRLCRRVILAALSRFGCWETQICVLGKFLFLLSAHVYKIIIDSCFKRNRLWEYVRIISESYNSAYVHIYVRTYVSDILQIM